MKNVEQVLLGTKKVSKEAVANAMARYDDPEDNGIWRSFVAAGDVSEVEVFQSLARTVGIQFVDVRRLTPPAEVIAAIPARICREESLIPLTIQGKYLYVGLIDPSNLQAIDQIQAMSSYTVIPKVISPSALATALNNFYRQDEEIGKLSEELEAASEADEESDAGDIFNDSDEDSPIVRFVNLIIAQAIRDRASDIHVEPSANELVVRYRIDGVLHVRQRADRGIQRGVISRLKVMGNIDIAERRVPQDGRVTIPHAGRKIDIRMTTLPTVWGEKIVMRILDGSSLVSSIKSLEMTSENERKFRNAVSKPHGIVLITGPTGSGKSSTLYTTLDEVTSPAMSVVTVEDPIEKKMSGVSQVQVNNTAGLTFARALRSILRADPDVVLIGEIRDEETAQIAIDASMTGHLVLTTLHTNGAPEAAARLTEMGVEPYLVGSAVSCVVAQRLARRLCEDCKRPTELNDSILTSVRFPVELRGTQFYEPVGCNSCSGGYKGRIALTEVMEITEAIEKHVVAGDSARVIRRTAEGEGLVSLRNDGFAKVAAGVTTVREVMRVTN